MSEVSGNAEPQLRINNEWRSRGYLPHRERIGLLQSITFRLADSLPQEKLRELEMVKHAELGLSASRFWMHDYWDRYIRDEQHLLFVIDYIHNNPVKAGLCLKETDWLWSSAYKFHASIKNQHME